MTQPALLLIFMPIYGITLMTALLGPDRCNFNRKKIIQLAFLFAVTLFFNLLILDVLGVQTYRKMYLVLVQLPVFIGFCIICNYETIKIFFTLLTVVALSTVPIVSVVVSRLLSGDNPTWRIVSLALSSAVVFLLIFRFRANYIYMLKYGNTSIFRKFCIVPILFYIYTFSTSGYDFTQYYDSDHFLVRRIPEVIVFATYLLYIDVFKHTHETEVLKNQENSMLMQLNMATEQVSHLRATEKQSAIYRHDLRHHMNYLKACIDANKLAEASAYIEQIFEEIRQTQVEQYCSNESINLILASYASKAKQNNLSVDFDIKDVDFSGFQIIDLCSLLSNALENALEACKQMEKSDNRNIRLRIYEKNGKFCFHISNSYALLPVFQHGIPVASKEGHGMGTLSMIHVVEKYNGIYGFHAEDGKFTFRASM